MRKFLGFLFGFFLLVSGSTAFAVPVLQIGAPAGPGDTGIYADYVTNSTDPTEADTAITTGSTIYAAGVFGPNTVALGGQYDSQEDWGDVNSAYSVFNGHDAVLLAAIPDGTSGSLTVNGSSAFLSSVTLNGLFPDNHDPLKDGVSDFLFFDIGNFTDTGSVPDFYSETGSASGEIKALTIAASGYDWIHFDLLALETTQTGQINIRTSIENNPGSHDVTWKDAPPIPSPEPATMFLLGTGLVGLAGLGRKLKR